MSKTTNKFSPEVRERAVRLVLDNEAQHPSRWQAVMSIAAKIGCTPQTLSDWVKKAEVDSGQRAGIPTVMAERMKALERENRELRQGTRSCGRRRRILRWCERQSGTASSTACSGPTAGRSDGRGHRRPSRGTRGRADLRRAADRPVHLLRSSGEAGRSGKAVGSCPPGRRTAARDPARLRRQLERLRPAQGLTPATPRRV